MYIAQTLLELALHTSQTLLFFQEERFCKPQSRCIRPVSYEVCHGWLIVITLDLLVTELGH